MAKVSLRLDELEWDCCTDPVTMLMELADRTSLRKLRLFAVACCRRVLHLMREQHARQAVEQVAAAADSLLSCEGHRKAVVLANLEEAVRPAGSARHDADDAALTALAVVRANQVTDQLIRNLAVRTAISAARATGKRDEPVAQAHLVREVFGNPHRTVRVSAEWLAWGGGTVRKVAESIYDEEAFGQLPVLADALEEAGCPEGRLLQHFRESGEHVRGCWALDLLLGKS
jgi:hypothetical protein